MTTLICLCRMIERCRFIFCVNEVYFHGFSLFRNRDILVRILILGSVHLITDPDPAPNPDTALFFSDFKDGNKK